MNNMVVTGNTSPTTLVYNPPETTILERPPIPEGLQEAASITREIRRQDALSTNV